MNMSDNFGKRSISLVQSVFYFGNILAIAPPYVFNVKNSFWKLKLYQCYALFVSLVIFIAFVHSIFGRLVDVYPYFPSPTLTLTDASLNFVLTLTCLSSIFFPSYWHSESFVLFLNLHFELYFSHNNITSNKLLERPTQFYVKLALGHIIIIILFAFDVYIMSNFFGMIQYRNYIFRLVQYYYMFGLVMIIYLFVSSLRNRFKTTNNLLETVTVSSDLIGKINETREIKLINLHNMETAKQACLLYETALEQISLFNKTFGWQILFLAASIVVGFINTLDLLMVFGVFRKQDGEVPNLEFPLIVLTSSWSIGQLVCNTGLLIIATIVAASCDVATREAHRTAEVCYKLLLKLPLVSEKLQDRALREQLYLLSQMSSQCCPSFSAAGFFRVDYSMLLALFGSVTSYVIVVIQFNK